MLSGVACKPEVFRVLPCKVLNSKLGHAELFHGYISCLSFIFMALCPYCKIKIRVCSLGVRSDNPLS